MGHWADETSAAVEQPRVGRADDTRSPRTM